MLIGLDVGGTHTDAVLLDKIGLIRNVKVATNPLDLFNTVLSGLDLLLDGIDPLKIKRIVLSTTLTTNAIVQRRTKPVGIIVSSGPGIDPKLFGRGKYYFPVAGSIDHRGRERSPINPDEILAVSEQLRHLGIKHVGVIGKFSPRNPFHELLIKELIDKDFDKIFLGHQVSGNLNFPRRIATVLLNTSVYSIHRSFFNAVKGSLEQKGLTTPIQILKADGGTMSLEASMDFPGQTILSGPAASVMGAIAHAPANEDVLVLDIGGTTTDIAILVDKAPLLEPVGIGRGRYQSLIRSLKTLSRGIGGDSHVRVKNGVIKIGPLRSGPALAFGGPEPTPTDAMIVLGIMTAGDRQKALDGMADIAGQLGTTPVQAADTIFKTCCAMIVKVANKMVTQINSKPVYTVHEFLEGYQIKPRKILLLGGPARFFAPEIERQSGIETRSVPASSVANAIGAALARTTCEVSLSADTEQKIASAPEEDFSAPIPRGYTEDDVIETAYTLLHSKAIRAGSQPEDLEIEVIEFQKFNIVRKFSTQGKIYRAKLQVKPGLIKGYDNVYISLNETFKESFKETMEGKC
ncbi:putative hydantoinase/oxoprolinase family protein [Desulforapulum autotrophicum HRM2]|uniref:Hydantoinase/oxoprolinase family protein n=1 Tax=Desulforapulum autotrophicum (strain ATCC 43914 / DSM 3382 / VKM B-1955 / HRM2) TaxID=177437 RepID=C0QKV7_DESAH|nr:hydantoinase/oxoprolinase family protein [Desulforapulum autotrophicum]ACN16197.1 putative hydantoinase/oxoprolinase family protein [Desulforapulum autotrophicum HRM2]